MSSDVHCCPHLVPASPRVEPSSNDIVLKGPLYGPSLNTRLARPSHPAHIHSASLPSHLPAHTHTHTNTHVLCTRIIPWLHSSRIRSIFYPSKIHLPSLFSGGRAVVSQRSISRQCETAAPAKTRPRRDESHPLLSPDKSTLEAQPSS